MYSLHNTLVLSRSTADLFDLFLEVSHTALATVRLDQHSQRVISDGQLLGVDTGVALRLRNQVLL